MPPVEESASADGIAGEEGNDGSGSSGIIIINNGNSTATRRRRFGRGGTMSGRAWLLLLLAASVSLSAYHVAMDADVFRAYAEVDYGGVIRFATDVKNTLLIDDVEEEEEPAAEPTPTALDELIDEVTTPSLRALLTSLRNHAPIGSYLDPIDDDDDQAELRTRCSRYGYGFDPTRLPPVDDDEEEDDGNNNHGKNETRRRRRRIFMGGLIADDSWHAIAAHAAEAYGMYHTVAFVESNKTQMLYNRTLRFSEGSLNLRVLQSGIFGPDTDVSVDLYVDEPDQFDAKGNKIGGRPPHGLLREHLQREVILEMWKRNGMTTYDVGFVSDTDEMFTRDFLIAAQTCDVPQFRVPGQDCRSPKVSARTLVFEASPECITADRSWYHPDMIIGECVDTIGNSTQHRPAVREYRGKLGKRSDGYGRNPGNYGKMPGTTMYPLWKPVDFRATGGGASPSNGERVNGTTLHYTGYHLHNFFDSIEVLRRKYKTYGHPIRDADEKPLRQFHPDVNLTIHCVTDRDDAGDKRQRRRGGYDAHVGPRPLVFEYGEYRAARQAELRNMTLEDEARYGRRRRRLYLREVSGLE